MREIDDDGALRLVGAIARQWIKEQPDEIPLVATWLHLEEHQLRRKQARAEQAGNGVTHCRQCGRPLPVRYDDRGRRMYCSKRCCDRSSRARNR